MKENMSKNNKEIVFYTARLTRGLFFHLENFYKY